jgi:RHS repeat-associated protein
MTHVLSAQGNRTHTTDRIVTVLRDLEYNVNGQVTAEVWPDNGMGHRRRDEFVYYASGPQNGYLHRKIVDATGFALTTTYEYDAVGNRIREINPRNFDTLYTVNALNQVVRETSAETAAGSGIRYLRDSHYDANNNIVRVDVQNIDELGVLQPNAWFTTEYAYDALDRLIQTTREVDESHSVVEQSQYDANGNQTLVRKGEAVNGNQPANTIQSLYDERDLLFKSIRAPLDLAHSTTQYDYDPNRNRRAVRAGLEGTPRVTTYQYDGFDRLIRAIDPMGNETSYHFDPNSNEGTMRIDGQLIDVPGNVGNVRLAEGAYTYDAMDRLRPESIAYFNTNTQAPIGTGQSVTDTSYSDNSQNTLVTDDNGRQYPTTYDTAHRPRVSRDPKDNTTTYSYDAAGNVSQTVELEKSGLGGPDQTITTAYVYDGLNRVIHCTDNAGNVLQYAYDSRHNIVLQIDPRGNRTRYVYDGLDRLIQTQHTLTTTGDGSGSVSGTVVVSQTWDDSSRRTGRSDDEDHATTYAYDALDRLVTETFADNTSKSRSYDIFDNVLTYTDPNGTVVTGQYDLLNRLTQRSITPGPDVSGETTIEIYQYDGRSRIIRAEDNDSVATFEYNSLSQITRHTLQIAGGPVRTTLAAFDGENNLTSLTYPGGRTITRTHDELDRLSAIQEGPSTIASYLYVGPVRALRRDYGNGTRLDYTYDAIRRVTGLHHLRIAGGTSIDQRTFTWDAARNRTSATDLLAGPLSRTYAYDSLDRLIHSEVAPGGPTIDYSLSGTGNRLTVSGGPDAGAYSCSPAIPEPADCQVNQYSATPFDTRTSDRNGNLSSITAGPAGRLFEYDWRNQLVTHYDIVSGSTTTYRYDALGRRIEKNVDGTATRFYSYGWREIEEQNGANVTLATHVWGNGADELLQTVRGASTYYFHADDQDSVVKATDAAGNVVEQYRYGDFGQPLFLNAAGTPIAATAIGNATLYTGRRYDPESGLYYYRTRYLESRTGRFTTRDSIGIWGDENNLGNGFTYVGNNPHSATDPMGLGLFKKIKKAFSKLRKAIHDAPKKIRKWTKEHVRSIRNAVKNIREDFGTKLRRVFRQIYQRALTGAITGFFAGLISGGPVGALLGAVGGALEGAITGAIYGSLEQFFGIPQQTSENAVLAYDLISGFV